MQPVHHKHDEVPLLKDGRYLVNGNIRLWLSPQSGITITLPVQDFVVDTDEDVCTTTKIQIAVAVSTIAFVLWTLWTIWG